MQVKKIVGKKLKEIRLKQDMTIQILAEKSQVSSNMISRIERGLTIPSVEILMRLATVFDKSINYFVEEVSSSHEVVHTRPGMRDTTVYDDKDNMHTESFTSGLRDPQFMSFYCTVPKGGQSGEQNMYHPGDELIYMLDGRLKMKIVDEVYVLETGDSLSFKSHLPHRWENIGDNDAKVIWTLSPFTII
ncbi:MAG: XRE family transcriptional regulator [Deltaproteobacteria bacterium]|jgi:transcriptional regulator with XRE-family HTH domain|nr:XRE family transcriptional regulator [Deltaproteobacteria bacterium]MCW8892117.1 XRE family transcriptional regulator [Deltaproteobacteria bacterium]MCW9050042.1 XRE family transcriptional regulator [Deltaproteobacteria bacterium]